MPIRQLPPVVVNRIAAGEVIERPAAAVKELVENAIDAGASHIEVVLHEGGQALIAVADDGVGMSADELDLAVERHCTSKLPGDDDRALLRLAAAVSREARLAALLGRDFADNSLPVVAERDGFRLSGLIGLPTLNRGLPRDQYLVVNGRPVRDKLLVGCVRAAYQDVLARDRHPVVALFLDGPAAEIDVNVHPAKAEVRFRDANLIRGLIVGALRHALEAAGQRASTTVADAALAAFRPGNGGMSADATPRFAFPPSPLSRDLAETGNGFLMPGDSVPGSAAELQPNPPTEAPLGAA